jgi:serine-type D-Ala-D-Ala carboxypeptidase (penicillin-binding protein 5/6)
LRLGIPMTIKMEREAIALKTFYNKMNETAKELGLKNSNWSVSHGMYHYDNFSSAYDVAVLSRHCLSRHGTLREIVNTKKYTATSYIDKDHIYTWENTNYMLWD